MNNMFVALNPGIYSDPKTALVIIEIGPLGHRIVRQCSSWEVFFALAKEFNIPLAQIPWPEREVLQWWKQNGVSCQASSFLLEFQIHLKL
jgi:hypothetical protein